MDEVVKVYWQPGCSSCLKTKEFLETNNIVQIPDWSKDQNSAFNPEIKLTMRAYCLNYSKVNSK